MINYEEIINKYGTNKATWSDFDCKRKVGNKRRTVWVEFEGFPGIGVICTLYRETGDVNDQIIEKAISVCLDTLFDIQRCSSVASRSDSGSIGLSAEFDVTFKDRNVMRQFILEGDPNVIGHCVVCRS